MTATLAIELFLRNICTDKNYVLLPEYKFLSDRKFRFDWAIPELMIAFEYEGGVFSAHSGHTSGRGYSSNCEKYNLAALNGWKVIRFTAMHIKDGGAFRMIDKIFGGYNGHS
jgi:hypothetical protein